MGGSKSKVNAESGTLNGAYAPSLAGVTIPPQPDGKKTFQATVPKGKGLGGQMMGVSVHGSSINVLIPVGKKVGDTFRFTLTGNIHQVIASTLNEVPGMETAQAKPITYSTYAILLYNSLCV